MLVLRAVLLRDAHGFGQCYVRRCLQSIG
jgi:hypothetical protein